MKVKFIKSPTGKFKLAYSVDGVMDCSNRIDLAKKLINEKYAIEIIEPAKRRRSKKVN